MPKLKHVPDAQMGFDAAMPASEAAIAMRVDGRVTIEHREAAPERKIVDVKCQYCGIEFRALAGEQAWKEQACTPCFFARQEAAKKGKKR